MSNDNGKGKLINPGIFNLGQTNNESDENEVFTETIKVSDWAARGDVNTAELTRILRQIAKVANYMGGNIMRVSAMSATGKDAGAGSPITQAVLQIASVSEGMAIQLERAATQIMPANGPIFPGNTSGHPTGRA